MHANVYVKDSPIVYIMNIYLPVHVTRINLCSNKSLIYVLFYLDQLFHAYTFILQTFVCLQTIAAHDE